MKGMKRVKQVLGIMLCMVMLFSAICVNAALPAQTENGVALPNFNRNIYKINKGNGGAGGTHTTAFDDEFGKVQRWTTNIGENTYNRFSISLYFADDKNGNPGIKKGDKFYVSYYYRLNTPETDSNVTAAANGLQMAKFLHDYINLGTIDVASAEEADGKWHRYEGVIQMNDNRTYWESAMHFNMGVQANSVASIDFAGIRVAHLGAATDEEDGTTVLQQVQNTFSTNSKIKSIKIGDTEIDLVANPYYYTVFGSANSIRDTVKVVTEDPTASTRITIEDENTCLIRVFSARADLLNPLAGEYTDYTIVCETPEVIIGANEGRGVAATADRLYKREAEADINMLYDETFGVIYRYGAFYTQEHKWPKFDLDYKIDKTDIKASDYIYFSFYYRVNTAEQDSRVTAVPKYICRAKNIVDLKGGTVNLDISNVGVWKKAEYLINAGGSDREVSNITAYFQYGLDESNGFGKYVSFDFAAPECYYLGNVTYYDGATQSDLEESTINKLKTTFTKDKTLSSLNVCGNNINLAQNLNGVNVPGSQQKILNSLKYTTTETGAHTAVLKTGDNSVTLRTYSHLADIPNAKECQYNDYVITSDMLIKDYVLMLNGNEITDYSAFAAGEYTLGFNVKNASDTDFTGTIHFGIYDENGMLTGAGSVNLNETAGSVERPVTITASSSVTPLYFKIFAFDGMKPFMSITTINQNGINE